MVANLTFNNWVVIAILICTMIAFVFDLLRVDAIGILLIIVIGAIGLLPPEQLYSGFANEAVVSLMAIMVISASFEKTGISQKITRWIINLSKDNSNKTTLYLMISSGLLASFMRALGTVGLLMPVVARISMRTGIAKSKLLMPMTFCAALGGNLTMMSSSPLILVQSLLGSSSTYVEPGYPLKLGNLNIFDITPVGLGILSVGIIYLYFLGRKLLPSNDGDYGAIGIKQGYFKKVYGKGENIVEVRVPDLSDLINKSIKDLETLLLPSMSILALYHKGNLHFPPLRKEIILENSHIALMGNLDEITKFCEIHRLKVFPKLSIFSETLNPMQAGICEAVVPPSSALVGVKMSELHMKRQYNLNVIAVYRDQKVYSGDDLKNVVLRSGDTLGMFSKWETLADFVKNPDFIVLTSRFPKEKIMPQKMVTAILAFVFPLILILFKILPVSVGLWIVCFFMVVGRVITLDKAYDAINWRTVFLIAGMMPLGLVLQTTRTANIFTEWLTYYTSGMNVIVVEFILAISSTFFSLVLTSIGATVLLVPIAFDLAVSLDASPVMFALIVALSSSNTFLLPTNQANALILGPGNYVSRDFIKVGGILTLVFWVAVVFFLNLMFMFK